MGEGIGE